MKQITKEVEEEIYWTLRYMYSCGKNHSSKNIRKEARELIEKINKEIITNS